MLADRIKSILSMTDVAIKYGFIPNRSGFINCPFHADKTASMKIYPEPGRGFCCFGCGKLGSVIDFVMQLLNLTFGQTLIRLNSDFSLGLSSERPDPVQVDRLRREQAARRRKEAARRAELNRLSADHCTAWWTLKTGTALSDEWWDAVLILRNTEIRMEVLEKCQTTKTN